MVWVTAKIYGGEAAATNLMDASFPHRDPLTLPTISAEMITTDAASVFLSLSLSLFHSLPYVSIYSSHILKSTKTFLLRSILVLKRARAP